MLIPVKPSSPNFDFKIAPTLKNNMSAAIFKNGSTIILKFLAKLSEIKYFVLPCLRKKDYSSKNSMQIAIFVWILAESAT